MLRFEDIEAAADLFIHPPWPVRFRTVPAPPPNAIICNYGQLTPFDLFYYDTESASSGDIRLVVSSSKDAVAFLHSICKVDPLERPEARKRNLDLFLVQIQRDYFCRFARIEGEAKGKKNSRQRRHIRSRLKERHGQLATPDDLGVPGPLAPLARLHSLVQAELV